MRSLLKTPQAMSTPITEVSRSVLTELIMKDSVPLPTPVVPTTSQEERKLMSDTDVTNDVPATAPIFNLNRANVQAASSVSSLDEGEGIVNDDEYERAIQRLKKINKKIITLVRNWNEESKSAKNSNEVVEIDEFYRPYMDLYVMRRRGRLAPRQPLSVCALLPAYEGNRHLRPLGNLGHCLRRPRWID